MSTEPETAFLAYRSKVTGQPGHGQAIPIDEARRFAASANVMHPEIQHWAIPNFPHTDPVRGYTVSEDGTLTVEPDVPQRPYIGPYSWREYDEGHWSRLEEASRSNPDFFRDKPTDPTPHRVGRSTHDPRLLTGKESPEQMRSVIEGNLTALQLRMLGLKQGPDIPGLRPDSKEVLALVPEYPADYRHTVGRDGSIIVTGADNKPGNPIGPMVVGPAADNEGGPVYGLGGRIVADKAQWETEAKKLLTHQVVLDSPEGLMALGHPTTKGAAEKMVRHMVEFTTETLGPDAKANNIKAVDISTGEHVVDNSNLYGSDSWDEFESGPEMRPSRDGQTFTWQF